MKFALYWSNRRAAWAWLILTAVWLASCADATPTRIALAPTPVVSTAVTRLPLPDMVAWTTAPAIVAEELAVTPILFPVSSSTPIPPTPRGRGVPPGQVQVVQPPALDVEGPADWRPPPAAVPLSYHPDDHYWLIRPIPSGRRNYDLEWYPYGNNVLLFGLGPYRIHHGIDFPNETGTPVLAAGSGTVIHAGPLPSNRDGVNYYGNTVIIQHDWRWLGQDVYTLYAHTLELFVEAGDQVVQGQLVAGVGASGEVSGPHLHLEVRVGSNHYNSTRNPMLWLAPYEGWGTLAGRFIDNRGRFIRGGQITIEGVNVQTPRRVQHTYMGDSVVPDDIWRENFVVADLPAGRYKVLLTVAGKTFQRMIEVRAGQTNFMVVQADFAFSPSPTPLPTATPTPTATPEEDIGSQGTLMTGGN
jgi:murein DD-endopeptidase MepM/ murein hydrolase activator NlpD